MQFLCTVLKTFQMMDKTGRVAVVPALDSLSLFLLNSVLFLSRPVTNANSNTKSLK